MRAVRWLWHVVTANFGWKVLSLAIAITVWALVANEPELLTQVRVGVEYKSPPADLEINSDLGMVVLEVSGSSGELRGINDGGIRPEVILDLSDARPGLRTFVIGQENVKLPHGVRLVRANPPQVSVTIVRRKVPAGNL